MTNTFENFRLNPSILRALSEEGYRQPTPIQLAAIPEVLAGRDLIGTAQTGTGKTAAFSLPLLETLHRRRIARPGSIRALVLTPTRELALQVELSLRTYGRHLPFRSAVVLGGVSMGSQVKAIRRNPEILVATPGRLLDLMDQGIVKLDHVEILVLDEADRMLDMGFIHDVREIVSNVPRARQTLLFSATMSLDVKALAADMLKNPAMVSTTPPASVSTQIDQKVLFVEQSNKGSLLVEILKGQDVNRALVFTRTKHRADRLSKYLRAQGISADAIHSNKSQNARQEALAGFDRGRIRVLVATDIVARGIDVDGISHVINYEMPNDASSYVHRIGRTARAGAAGIALSLCDGAEVAVLKDIEKLTKSPIVAHVQHRFHSATIASMHNPAPAKTQWRSFGPSRRGRR